jgi:hypothetical protein
VVLGCDELTGKKNNLDTGTHVLSRRRAYFTHNCSFFFGRLRFCLFFLFFGDFFACFGTICLRHLEILGPKFNLSAKSVNLRVLAGVQSLDKLGKLLFALS